VDQAGCFAGVIPEKEGCAVSGADDAHSSGFFQKETISHGSRGVGKGRGQSGGVFLGQPESPACDIGAQSMGQLYHQVVAGRGAHGVSVGDSFGCK